MLAYLYSFISPPKTPDVEKKDLEKPNVVDDLNSKPVFVHLPIAKDITSKTEDDDAVLVFQSERSAQKFEENEKKTKRAEEQKAKLEDQDEKQKELTAQSEKAAQLKKASIQAKQKRHNELVQALYSDEKGAIVNPKKSTFQNSVFKTPPVTQSLTIPAAATKPHPNMRTKRSI